MRPSSGIVLLTTVGLLVVSASVRDHAQQGDKTWQTDFALDKSELQTTGRGDYFILEPGYEQILEGDGERLVVRVLDETKPVSGIETRVIEERETKTGQLVEISRNYFAINKRTNDVYYFGEEVDIYKNGKVVDHEGAWLAGSKGAKFGLAMPGRPALNTKYYQEIAPGVAMDRAEIVSLVETVRTPAGEFKNCLKTAETTPLEPGVREFKYYARGVGLIQDGSLKLVKYGKTK
jgi:hypothetical protein